MKLNLDFTSPHAITYTKCCQLAPFFSKVQVGKVPMYHFCFHYETHETWHHSNVRSLTAKMATLSTVRFHMDHYLVKEKIWPSTPRVTPIAIVIMMSVVVIVVVTLAPRTSHHMGISITPNKSSCCLLVDATFHQQKLKYFIE